MVRHLLLLLSGAAALLLAAAACDGEGRASLEEYLRGLESLIEEGEARFEVLEEPSEDLSDEEALQAGKESFAEFFSIIQDITAKLEELDPPREAEDAHNDLVEAARTFRNVGEDLEDDVEAAETREEIEGVFEDFFAEESEEAGSRFDAACIELQALADDQNIDVDLMCGEDE